jgi:hypothetical protein
MICHLPSQFLTRNSNTNNMNFENTFGSELVTKSGVQATSTVLADKRLIGVYFSGKSGYICVVRMLNLMF